MHGNKTKHHAFTHTMSSRGITTKRLQQIYAAAAAAAATTTMLRNGKTQDTAWS